ncbi:Crp/Fnr family transcriptional regulator [Polynucleobacter kasalickyi]|uniref:cAMP-binding domain of CRP or a regulatory subunit of cAMP-dependent protein kinases n=1 Tax=Polynucleobacter kasalickyi TaxID=1938817 RepID=A0A1W2C365_9BURK|nr:Crp/Fnr family transcriptional regulator [Polynucleobacter kasalickyi]SMC79148.1 cAMP-binding domain of CRP or a regulatory subunit of cAMP-dependent protein kinases [Polynucleobacter kasalickyi]
MLKTPLKDQNHLFHSIPTSEWERLLPHIEAVEMPLGMVMSEPGMKLSHAYFPSTAIVSVLHALENGTSAEVAAIGNEGLIGISIFMGGGTSSSSCIVKSAGLGYRIKSHILLEEFNYSTPLMHLFLRFTQALITQITQTAVCNRHHLLEQQLCRLLLVNLDRLPSNQLLMTQELIARLLGVRREGVTEAALKIQSAGFIKYARGQVTILDRIGLEKRSCECYKVVKTEYQRLLPERMAI